MNGDGGTVGVGLETLTMETGRCAGGVEGVLELPELGAACFVGWAGCHSEDVGDGAAGGLVSPVEVVHDFTGGAFADAVVRCGVLSVGGSDTGWVEERVGFTFVKYDQCNRVHLHKTGRQRILKNGIRGYCNSNVAKSGFPYLKIPDIDLVMR